MNLKEAFAALRSMGEERAAGARHLYEELTALTKRHGADGDDLAQEIIARWLAQPPDVRAGDIGTGYLVRALRNQERSGRRGARREAREGDLPPRTLERANAAGIAGTRLELGETPELGAERDRALAAGWALLERVAEATAERARPAQQDGLRATWAEMKALHIDETRTREELLEAAAALEPGTRSEILRNRFFQRHKRFREAFVRTARELGAEGVLDDDAVALVEAAYHTLLTDRPRKNPPRSA